MDRLSAVVRLATRYQVFADRPYHVAGKRPLSLDLYVPQGEPGPSPIFVFFHGGGWVTGSKEAASLHLLPWMIMGWAVANVEYRLAREALAPTAAWDARRALRWVVDHAADNGLDADRIVLGGMSSGAHLALLTGMGAELPSAAGEDRTPVSAVRASAVVNWFGISDVAALLQGERPRAYARRWIGRRPDGLRLAEQLSPLRWVGRSTPPVMSIHGDRDPTVPYDQSLRLREALERVGVSNRLLTVPDAGHGKFEEEQWAEAYRSVFAFLEDHLPPGSRRR
ncbi:MAG: alpha/beta hydrolase [Gemmatimonadota bacterium]